MQERSSVSAHEGINLSSHLTREVIRQMTHQGRQTSPLPSLLVMIMPMLTPDRSLRNLPLRDLPILTLRTRRNSLTDSTTINITDAEVGCVNTDDLTWRWAGVFTCGTGAGGG